jgi:regulator of nucleoside diphosphate kinase
MKLRRLWITDGDFQRLREEVEKARNYWGGSVPFLSHLMGELRRAWIVSPAEISPKTVTMNSRLVLKDLDSDEPRTVVLKYPDEARGRRPAVSVLSPLGMALLGDRVGEVVWWNESAGPRMARIDALIYQPEAAGDFHL